MNLDTLQSEVLSLSPAASADRVAETLVKLNACMERAKEMKAQLEQQVLSWCEVNGDLTIGDVRYYAGVEKKTTPAKEPAQMLESLLSASGGDCAAVAGCLSSSAWKYGAVRELVGEEKWAELFSVTVVPDLRTGKPLKRLQQRNERFAPARAGKGQL